MIVTLVALVLVAGLATLVLLMLPSARARPGTSNAHLTRLLALAEARRAPGENAWPRYIALREELDRLVADSTEGRDSASEDDPLDRIWHDPFDIAPLPADRAAFAAARPLVDQLIAASMLPRCSPDPDPHEPGEGAAGEALGATGVVEAAIKTRRLLKPLRAEMRVAAEEGRWDLFAEYLDASLRLANQAGTSPLLISLLFLGSSRATPLLDVRRLAAHYLPPPDAIDMLLRAIDGNPPPADAATTALDTEHLYTLHAMNDFYADSGLALVWAMDRQDDVGWLFGMPSLDGPPTIRERALNVRAYSAPRRPAAERAQAGYFEALRAWVAIPTPQRPVVPVIPEQVKSFRAIRDWSPIGFSVSRLFADGVRMLDEAPAATRVCQLICKHRAATGDWPAALAAAGADLPNPVTGAPFFYEVTPDGPAPFRLARTRETKPFGRGDYSPALPAEDAPSISEPE